MPWRSVLVEGLRAGGPVDRAVQVDQVDQAVLVVRADIFPGAVLLPEALIVRRRRGNGRRRRLAHALTSYRQKCALAIE